VSDTGLVALLLATVAGFLAGRAWAARRHDRPRFRTSPHYAQGLHYLSSGQIEAAIAELTEVTREDPGAIEVLQVLSHLLREAGHVERAIQQHQALLARGDLTRTERTYVLAALGTDFRKAGLLDRAAQAYGEALEADPNNLQALSGQQKLYEDQALWPEAYELQARICRLRGDEDRAVLGHLKARIGMDAAHAGRQQAAEAAFEAALSLDPRNFPAHVALAELSLERDPSRAAALLESAIAAAPERAYLAFPQLERAYTASGEPSRFVALCERLIGQDPRDWRARVALARHLRAQGRPDESLGLLLRAVEANPHALLVHLEVWRTYEALGTLTTEQRSYLETAERSSFYLDPHICTTCRYRADDMLWRCPHCHEWSTFVEERLAFRAELR
jgi:lipopolysaccharide biosynthesis regulator YciM